MIPQGYLVIRLTARNGFMAGFKCFKAEIVFVVETGSCVARSPCYLQQCHEYGIGNLVGKKEKENILQR